MKELEKLRYFESVLAGTHMLLESMEAKDLHLAFKVVSELQSKIVYLLTRIVHQEAYKSNFPSGSNSFAAGRSSLPVQRGRESGVPIISSVNTSRLSLDSRKTSPGRLDGDNLLKKRNSIANGVGIFWAMNTFLLPTPDINVSPDSELSNELTRQGFGLSMSSSSDRRQMINTTCTADELMVQICRRYPRVPALSRVGFTYHYRPSGNQRHLIPITSKMPYDLYSLLGNEGVLYLRPKAPLKSIPSRQGPQEPICIDDDDEDASQPAPISTGRRQQPNSSPGMSAMRASGGSMHSASPSGVVPGPILQQQRGGPSSAMPPPQMVPGLRTTAPSSAIPLPSMNTQRSVPASAAIQLPVAPSQSSSVPMFSSPASSVPPGPHNSVETTPTAISNSGVPNRMSQMQAVQRQPPLPHTPPNSQPMPQPMSQPMPQPMQQPMPQPMQQSMPQPMQQSLPQPLPQHPHPHPQIEVLKIPIEGGTPPTPKPLPNDETPSNRGEPPEKRQAMGPSPIATTIPAPRRMSNHTAGPQSVSEAANVGQPGPETESTNSAQQQQQPPASNVGGLSTTDLINQIKSCLDGENHVFLKNIIRKAMLSQGHFFSARSFIRTLVPGAKRQVLTDPRLNPVIIDVMRKMADEELGTVHLEVGAKNARDTGFIKAWPINNARLHELGIPETEYAQTMLMTTTMVPGTVERDLTTLSAAADWPKRKQTIVEYLRVRGLLTSSNNNNHNNVPAPASEGSVGAVPTGSNIQNVNVNN